MRGKKFRSVLIFFVLALCFFTLVTVGFQYFKKTVSIEIKSIQIHKNLSSIALSQIKAGQIKGVAEIKKATYTISVKDKSWKFRTTSKTNVNFSINFSQKNSTVSNSSVTLNPRVHQFDITFTSPITIISPIGLATEISELKRTKADGNESISADIGLALNETILSLIAYIFHLSDKETQKLTGKSVDKIFKHLYIEYCSLILAPNAKLSFNDNNLCFGKRNEFRLKEFLVQEGGKIEGKLETCIDLISGTNLKINEQAIKPKDVKLCLIGNFIRDKDKLSCTLKTKDTSSSNNRICLDAGKKKDFVFSDIFISTQGDISPNLSLNGSFETVASASGFSSPLFGKIVGNAVLKIKKGEFAVKDESLNISFPDIQVMLGQNETKELIKGLLPSEIPIDLPKKGHRLEIKPEGKIENLRDVSLTFRKNKVSLDAKPHWKVELKQWLVIRTRFVWHKITIYVPKIRWRGLKSKVEMVPKRVTSPTPTIHKDWGWKGFKGLTKGSGTVEVSGNILFSIEKADESLRNLKFCLTIVPGRINIKNFPNFLEKHFKPGGASLRELIKREISETHRFSLINSVSGEAERFLDRIIVKSISLLPKEDKLVMQLNLKYENGLKAN